MDDLVLGAIDIERALSRLHPADRTLIELVFRVTHQPDDWIYPWPPKFEHIGSYIGLKYEGSPLSEAAVRYRRDAILQMWAGERGALRRTKRG